MMKKTIPVAIAAALAVAALTACSAQGSGATVLHASYATAYPTLGQLVKSADIAVRGQVVDSKEVAAQDGIPFTDATFRVDTWIKGPGKSGDTITIHQTGGTLNGQKFVMENEPLLVPGEQAILYLKKAGDVYFALGGPTGRLEVKDGKVTKLPGTSLTESIPATVNDVTTKSESLDQ